MNKKPVTVFAFAVSAALLALAACAAPPTAAPKPAGPTEVRVKLSDFKVEVDKNTIPAGPVKFIIENAGKVEHELVLQPAGVTDQPLEASGKESEVEDIAAGKSAVLEWTVDKPGKYELACYKNEDNVDHYKAGMTTGLTVTAP